MHRYRHRDAIFERPTLIDTIALAIAVVVLVVLALTEGAGASGHAHPSSSPAAAGEPAAVSRVLRYWTPTRMRSARPLDLVLESNGRPSIRLGRPAPAAGASFLAVEGPEAPPNSVNGRIFVKQGKLRGYCSGTAIDSPTRQLVLTAGHCVNNGHLDGHTIWSQYLEFVPAYDGGRAPFGAFVSKRGKILAPQQWTKGGNPDFDLGAFLTHPNKRGLNVADAVGGGAKIALDRSRRQRFRTFGYPGNAQRLQGCSSPYAGDDSLTFPLAGPPTMGIRCHWAPGASGGGWLIDEGTEIDGLTSYLHLGRRSHTYGPYFSEETVGKLVRGL
ncbi:MAG: trypsin-like serine peptidase [Solirubrobacterales bacterium]